MNRSLTTQRSPLDHVLSGAIAWAIGGCAVELVKAKEGKSKSKAIRDALDIALSGGIIGGGAIYSANKLVQGEYLRAAAGVAVCVGALIAGRNFILKVGNE